MVTIRFGFNGAQQRTTCSMSARPPARCSTFAREDFSRVPLPAARMTMTTSLLGIVRPFSPALVALTMPSGNFPKICSAAGCSAALDAGANWVIDESTNFHIHFRRRSGAAAAPRRAGGNILEAMYKLPGKSGRFRSCMPVLRRVTTGAAGGDGAAGMGCTTTDQQQSGGQPDLRRDPLLCAVFDCRSDFGSSGAS